MTTGFGNHQETVTNVTASFLSPAIGSPSSSSSGELQLLSLLRPMITSVSSPCRGNRLKGTLGTFIELIDGFFCFHPCTKYSI